MKAKRHLFLLLMALITLNIGFGCQSPFDVNDPRDIQEESEEFPFGDKATRSSNKSCVVSDESSLVSCRAKMRNGLVNELIFTKLIPCRSRASCQINLDGMSNIVIRGNPNWTSGFLRLRADDFPIIQVSLNGRAKNILITDLVFNENPKIPNKMNNNRSPIHILDGENIQLNHINIKHFHDVGMWINSVDGFSLSNSTIESGYHLGVIVGVAGLPPQKGWGRSTHVKIWNNTFYRAGVNALVVNGVTGNKWGDNVISWNKVISSHSLSLYRGCDGIPNNYCGGGMVYIRDAQFLNFSFNNIEHGFCANCSLLSVSPDHNVRGIEFDGEQVSEHGQQKSVRYVKVIGNRISNLTAAAIVHNSCPTEDECVGWKTGAVRDIEFRLNQFINNDVGFGKPLTSESIVGTNIQYGGNFSANRQELIDFEDLQFTRWNQFPACSGSKVVRFCQNSLHGDCHMRLVVGAQCEKYCVRTPAYSIPNSKYVFFSGWARNGSSLGKNYIVFLDGSRRTISTEVAAIAKNPSGWRFDGQKVLQSVIPKGAAYYAIQTCAEGKGAIIDHDYWSIGY